jgi:hypothetical protein
VLRKALITLGAAVALGCVPFATNALAAPHGHVGGGHAMTGHARGGVARYGGRYRGGPVYDTYAGYDYNNGCSGNGVPLRRCDKWHLGWLRPLLNATGATEPWRPPFPDWKCDRSLVATPVRAKLLNSAPEQIQSFGAESEAARWIKSEAAMWRQQLARRRNKA